MFNSILYSLRDMICYKNVSKHKKGTKGARYYKNMLIAVAYLTREVGKWFAKSFGEKITFMYVFYGIDSTGLNIF